MGRPLARGNGRRRRGDIPVRNGEREQSRCNEVKDSRTGAKNTVNRKTPGGKDASLPSQSESAGGKRKRSGDRAPTACPLTSVFSM